MEYLCLTTIPSGFFKDKKIIIFENIKYKENDFVYLFNYLGNKNWNLVGITDFQNITRFYFKRKISS